MRALLRAAEWRRVLVIGAGNAVVRGLLRSPTGGWLGGRLLLLRYRGRRTGRTIELPVAYVQDGSCLRVTVGHPDRKIWWRNFTEPRPVEVRLAGRTRTGTGRLLGAGAAPPVVEIQLECPEKSRHEGHQVGNRESR